MNLTRKVLAICLFRLEKFQNNPSLKYWMEELIDFSDERFWVEDVTWTTSPPDPVEWVLLAVETAGVSRHLTGRYYMSDPFQVNYDEYPATQGYQKWLGKWEVGDGRIAYDLEIRENKKNLTYMAAGWEDDTDEIPLYYNLADGGLEFRSLITNESLTLPDGSKGYEIFTATVYSDRYQGYYTLNDNNILAIARFTEDDKASIEPLPIYYTDDWTVEYPFCMSFVAYNYDESDDSIYGYHGYDELPHFPMTMTRKSSLDHATNSFHNGSASMSDAPLAIGRRTGKVR